MRARNCFAPWLLVSLLGADSLAAAEKRSAENPRELPSLAEATRGFTRLAGLLDVYWDEDQGRILLGIDRFDRELLYVTSLASGIGSNDIGLDRGQLGATAVVEFRRIGRKVLLVQPNYRFRAGAESREERQAVAEAFASSVLFGFEVAAEEPRSAGAEAPARVLVDATDFVLRDAHGVARRLREAGQGEYRLELSRSAPWLERTRSFPRNTELEAMLTLTGEPQGEWIRSVAPTPEAVTVRQHHSFVELPEAGYTPRVFDPRSGYNTASYFDYATPISQPIEQRFITRHRLKKRDPQAASSEAVEPIVYYLDRGAPEPIRSALLEGARWWGQAFEAAGFRDAFRVELLPADADPMDLRYNVIQWVHRSTRGWSYGSSVVDPRTGEILKGHVTLGSLRVRQDFLIAQSLLAPYPEGQAGAGANQPMEQMALARLRQLSAHEVGHTLGLEHNYAASTGDRASVMDYPHPLVAVRDDGTLDLSQAYASGVGVWDRRAILYGYQDFPAGTDEARALEALVRDTIGQGLLFITDQDARPPGGAHPLAHLWDNGADAAHELDRVMAVRRRALDGFSEANVPAGTPLAMLEDVLVPVFLFHRYQLEAAVKLVGGVDYRYAVRGDGQVPVARVPGELQRRALRSVLRTLDSGELTLPARILDLLPPRAPGFPRTRESFPSRTGVTFDPVAAAEVAADLTVGLLLHPERASRLEVEHARDALAPGLEEVLDALLAVTWHEHAPGGLMGAVKRGVDDVALRHLMALAVSPEASGQARGVALRELEETAELLRARSYDTSEEESHRRAGVWQIERFLENPRESESPPAQRPPDGAPIGDAGMDYFE